MSLTFAKLLPLEIKEIGEYTDSPVEVQPKEKVIGVATDEQKALYTLVCNYRKLAVESKTKLTFEGKTPELVAQFGRAIAIADALWDVFWICVRDHFHLWNMEEDFGLRKGWNVVTFKSEDNPAHLLKKLLEE